MHTDTHGHTGKLSHIVIHRYKLKDTDTPRHCGKNRQTWTHTDMHRDPQTQTYAGARTYTQADAHRRTAPRRPIQTLTETHIHTRHA